MATQYVSSVAYTSVAQWAAAHTYAAGAIVRQLAAPTTGNERVFQTAAGGISGATEPAWVLTAGSSSPSDGTVTDWKEITGQEAKQGTSGTWAAPHARTANALASGWAAAGDTIYISSNSAETISSGTTTLTFPGTTAAPNQLVSVTQSTSVPPAAADVNSTPSASIATTLASSIIITGFARISGVTISAGSGNNSSSLSVRNSGATTPGGLSFVNCALVLLNTNNATNINFGQVTTNTGGCNVDLSNTTMQFGNAGQAVNLNGGEFSWRNTASALAGATFPTTLFPGVASAIVTVTLDGVDLSAAGSGKTIFGSSATSGRRLGIVKNCKLNASATLVTTPLSLTADVIYVDDSDSSATTGNGQLFRYNGTRTTELTDVKSGGATDGSTAFSWKIVTTANNNAVFPFTTEELFVWVAAGAHTVALDLLSSTTLTNAQVWMDVEYLGTSGAPLAGLSTTSVANLLTAGTNIPASAASWTTTGVPTPNAQIMTTGSFTTQQAGYIRIRVRCSVASLTFFVDPAPIVT